MGTWSKRTTYGSGSSRRTITQNQSKGVTHSYSEKVGSGSRLTQTRLPNGQIRTTRTYREKGGWVRRDVSTWPNRPRGRKPSGASTKTRKMSRAEAKMWTALFSSKWFWIVLGAFLISRQFNN